MKSKIIIFTSIIAILILYICINVNLLPVNNEFNISKNDSSGNTIYMDIDVVKDEDIANDLALIGMNVHYSGNAKGNIYVIAENAVIRDSSARNVLMLTKDNASMQGDYKSIYALGNEINFNGNANFVVLIGKSVYVDGNINGNLKIIATDITLSKNLNVTGVISIEGPRQPVYVDGINRNEVEYINTEEEKETETFSSAIIRWFKFLIWFIPSGILTSFLFMKVLGPLKRDGVDSLKKTPIRLFVIGLSILILVPATSLLFLIAIVGVQIGIVIILIYTICILISVSCLGVAIGELIFNKQKPYIADIIGTIINYILVSLPYVGVIVLMISIVYTFGAIALSISKKSKINENDTDAKFIIKI